jgi:hypothetical protein
LLEGGAGKLEEVERGVNEGVVAVARWSEYWKLFLTVEGCGSARQWVGTAPLFGGVSLVLDIRGGREVEERERK